MANSEDSELDEILLEFLHESRETVAEAEPHLIALERGEGNSAESIRLVFRLFHSMKGGASSLGFGRLRDLTHEAESLLALLRDSGSAPTSGEVDALCAALDCARQILDLIEKSGGDQTSGDCACAQVIDTLRAALSARGLGLPEQQQQTSAAPVVETTEARPLTTLDGKLSSFVPELRELLEVVESLALNAEKGPVEPGKLDEALRALHTFKGNCGFLGYGDPERLAHMLEETLVGARDNVTQIGAIATTVLQTCDALRSSLDTEKRAIKNLTIYSEALESARGRLRKGAGKSRKLGDVLIEHGVLTHEQLAELLKWQNKKVGELAVDLGLATPSSIEKALEQQQASPEAKPAAPPAPPVERGKDTANQYIRVGLEKLDSLLDQVGELITTAAAVNQSPLADRDEEAFRQSVAHLARITRSLHDTAMDMRMVPLSGTLRRLVRVSRDVSQRLGKRVDLVLVGEETEVDKTVAEALTDPLVHMVRNAIDHGIEMPAVRKAAGKPETGTVRIEAKHEGGEMRVELSDDGAGIDAQRVLAKATKLGLISADANPSQDEILDLVFLPGFSTHDVASDISGRGVGMDVVRNNLEAIRGRVQLFSQRGVGTRVVIRIPLTLAIIDAMLVRVANRLYAVPLPSIRESISSDDASLVTLPQRGEMLRVREELVPVLRLTELHKIPPQGARSERTLFVILESAGEQVALPVHEILGQRQMVIKPLDAYVGNITCASGCSITGTGDICLILDAAALLKEMANGSNPRANEPVAQAS